MFQSGNSWITYDSLNIIPMPVAQILVIQFSSAHVLIIMVVSFVYRYYVVCKPMWLRNFTIFRTLLVCLFVLVGHIGAILLGLPDEECEEEHGEEFLLSTGRLLNKTAYMCVQIAVSFIINQ